MRSHNRMREAQGLRPLPSKRKTRIPDPSIRIQGFGEDLEGDMGASPQSTYLESSRVTTLDRVLAQLTIDNHDSDSSNGGWEDCGAEAADEEEDVQPLQHSTSASKVPLHEADGNATPPVDGLAAEHPYCGYASPFPFAEPRRQENVMLPLFALSLPFVFRLK